MVTAIRHPRLPGDGERGGNPVELAVALPAILILLFGSIQVAAVFVARSTALNAAQSGVNAQRLHQAPAGAGEERAARFLTQAGGWLVDWDEPGPSCVTSATDVTCTVTGRSLSVVPGVSFSIEETAHGTAERWTAP
ncbi:MULTISPECIES: TadE/TadG family type IV pilus assembly protein [unclassified Micromonospora]|uniref:TadE/TadG family type IV pilus assembly protein n=1 Tax=unclassified Micromonospora TaxID=2617518 RepID=UPI001034497D|nr:MULTISPECIES: TadE family protein [unclassified Micromonospora]QKW11525.1 pilus assembly protein [Verrucosispora sp. NA02020]QKW11649.1 pilus assembly protein [Verrucosispora sp. NA02020]TBL31844.1 pilus assembly protein [Verrucosispora sp. SN26_14.1]